MVGDYNFMITLSKATTSITFSQLTAYIIIIILQKNITNMRCLKTGFLVFIYELFTSNQYAIVVVRRYLLHFARQCLLSVLVCEILLHVPLVYEIPSIPTPDISDPKLHLIFIASIIGIAVVLKTIRLLITIMYEHTKRRGAYEKRKFYEESTFLADSVKVKKNNENELRYYPKLRYDDYLKRGVGFYGSTLSGELLTFFTVGLEWILNILSKVFVIMNYYIPKDYL